MDKPRPIERNAGFLKIKGDASLRREIADLLVLGVSTPRIIDEFQRMHGSGFKSAIYYLIDSAPKAIHFVQQNRPGSTADEIRKIWFNESKGYRHHFDKL